MPDTRQKPQLVPVTIRVAPDELAAIDQLADAEQRDRSPMGRILIREALEARGALPATKRTRKGGR